MRTVALLIAINAALVPSVAIACLPPPPVEMARLPNESDETYHDRLVAGSWPNSWQTLLAERPRQSLDESDADFAARSATWEQTANREGLAAQARADVRIRAAQLAEEAARWSSEQIVLAESLGSTSRGRWSTTRFRVLDRHGSTRRERTVTLRHPLATDSCDRGPPAFPAGSRWVIFAGSERITTANLIGYYNLESAQDPRTRSWLGGIRPDGTAIPLQR